MKSTLGVSAVAILVGRKEGWVWLLNCMLIGWKSLRPQLKALQIGLVSPMFYAIYLSSHMQTKVYTRLCVVLLKIKYTPWFSCLNNTLSSNNMKWLFSRSISSLYDCGGIIPLFFAGCFAGIPLCTALARSHRSISVRLGVAAWLGHCTIFFFFSHSVVDILLCLWSLFCCITQFQPSVSTRRELFNFD